MRQSRRWPGKLAAGILTILSCVSLYVFYLYATLALPRGEDRQPVRIYGAPYPLTPGLKVEPARLQDRLDHLGYHRVSRKLQAQGEYRPVGSSWELYSRDFLYPEGQVKGRLLRVVVEEGRVARVLSLPDERDAEPVSLEPQLVGGILATSRQVREWIPYTSIPPRLIEAVLAIEDHRFYHHVGIDPLAIARAAWENVKGGAVVQGGSTITQQLAKNLYYTRERTFLRKVRESLAALILEAKYTKQDILESYLNEIYLGQSGSVAIYGVGEAAHYYFGKPLSDLTVPEAALLAGMIKGPNTYAPVKDPKRAKKRRDLVLLRLRQEEKLAEKPYQAAVKTPIRAATLQKGLTDAPYFVDYLLSHVEDQTSSSAPGGLRIFTTLDPEMQRIAEERMTAGLARLETRYPYLTSTGETLQGALVAFDPKTGGIKAMVGGRDYRMSQFNHAVQAKRQAGSLFKPFVYVAAFDRSIESKDQAITPATLLEDAPISFPNGATPWSPQNYDRKFHGPVSVRNALEQSLNVPAVRVAQTVGIGRIMGMMEHLGIKGPLEDNLSLALGSSEVSLLEITGAYGPFAHEGRFVQPTGLRSVAGEQIGDILAKETPEPAQAFSPQAAYLMTSFLQGVVERGTAAQAKALGLTALVAGKTGTTDDHRDAWFVGYTPEVVIGVWVGFDDGTTLRLTGAQAALPIWIDFFLKAIPEDLAKFSVPAGIVIRMIDPQTAQLATSDCPESKEEMFIEGTEPATFCDVHSPGFIHKLKEMFGI